MDSRRLNDLEESLQPDGQDLILTGYEQQWRRGYDGTPILIQPQPQPIGFTEVEWKTSPRTGQTVGTRTAIFPPTNMDDAGN
jgi:hypothetical protein